MAGTRPKPYQDGNLREATTAEPVSARLHAATDSNAFFAMRFHARSADPGEDPAVVHIPLRPLCPGNSWEIWAGPEPVQRYFRAAVGTVATADHVVVHASEAVGDDLSPPTEALYLRLLGRVRDLGYPHLVRMWNFIPDINSGHGDAENYVRFNHGRAAAHDRMALTPELYPAATAIGTPSGSSLTVVLLASRTRPVAIENPRQLRPFDYPRRYGPRSPAFTRAMLLPDRTGGKLFISGTASIIGHESRHMGVEPQLAETLANIAELSRATLERVPGAEVGPRGSWRVYLRNPDDLAVVEAEVNRRLGSRDSVIYLQGDICRRELLVEIEGFCELTLTSPARG
jgi:chorismate lyase/3-hydroxybenzoate synthase